MSGWNTKQFISHWRHKKVKTWQLVILVLVMTGVSTFLLRQNNLQMVRLRSAVVMADTEGEGVKEAIIKLNEHIFKHMNTTTIRPVELVNTYNREAKRAIQAASQSNQRDVYGEATRVCEQRGVPLTSIAQCAAEYAQRNSPNVGPKKIILPDKNLFIYSFSSPFWTPDLAGFSVLITILLFIWLVLRTIEYVALRLVIRKRLKRGF